MQVHYSPPRETLRKLMAECHRLDLALSAGVRVALEWSYEQQGQPLPQVADRHRGWSAKTSDEPDKVLLYIPKTWAEALGGETRAIRKRASAAVEHWLSAGAPAVNFLRTSEHLRLREQAAKDNADAGTFSGVKIQLGQAREAVIAAANSHGLTAASFIRRVVADAYLVRTGVELEAAPETPAGRGRARTSVENAITVGFPIAWLIAIDTTIPGSRQAFMEAAICARVGIEKRAPERSPAVERMVEVRRERLRYNPGLRSSAPRPEMVQEARDESRWPAGCVVIPGGITGRPCVVTAARLVAGESEAA